MKTCEICGEVAEYIINKYVYMCEDCMESASNSEFCECIDGLENTNDNEDDDEKREDGK